VFAALAVLALGACGNDPARQGDLATFRAFGSVVGAAIGGGGGAPAPAAASPEAVSQALAQLPDGPVLRVALPRSGQSAFAVEAARNGPYRTFATLTGQTITLRGGVLTATRGFSGDLMSSDLGGLESLVEARTPGGVRRVYRFLDGADDEVPLSAECRIARSGEETITLVSGESLATIRLVETCKGLESAWRNSYWVAGDGAVRRAHQWAGPGLGDMRIETLRD
jgi:hypothetical protein